jgi:hypothetical protein
MRFMFSLWLLSQLHACNGAIMITHPPDIAQATPTRLDPRAILAIVGDETNIIFLS